MTQITNKIFYITIQFLLFTHLNTLLTQFILPTVFPTLTQTFNNI
jgi:hypothetical protein